MKIVEVVVGEVMRRRRNFPHRIKTGSVSYTHLTLPTKA